MMQMVSKVNFIAFIAEVINCTAQTNKQTDRKTVTEISVEKIQTLLGQSENIASSQKASEQSKVKQTI